MCAQRVHCFAKHMIIIFNLKYTRNPAINKDHRNVTAWESLIFFLQKNTNYFYLMRRKMSTSLASITCWLFYCMILNANAIFPDPNNRVAPNEPPTHHNDGRGYTITPERLAELRSHFLYWFFDKGGNSDNGDYQRDIHASNAQLHKNFNFQLPFYGFRFNYTRVSRSFNFAHGDHC